MSGFAADLDDGVPDEFANARGLESMWMSTMPSGPPAHPPSFSLVPVDPLEQERRLRRRSDDHDDVVYRSAAVHHHEEQHRRGQQHHHQHHHAFQSAAAAAAAEGEFRSMAYATHQHQNHGALSSEPLLSASTAVLFKAAGCSSADVFSLVSATAEACQAPVDGSPSAKPGLSRPAPWDSAAFAPPAKRARGASPTAAAPLPRRRTPVHGLLLACLEHPDVAAALAEQTAGRPVGFAAAHEHIARLSGLAAAGTLPPATADELTVARGPAGRIVTLLRRLEEILEGPAPAPVWPPADPQPLGASGFLRRVARLLESLHEQAAPAGPADARAADGLRRVLSSALFAHLPPRTEARAAASSDGNALQEAFLRNVLHPVALPRDDHTTVISIVALARLTGSSLKLPREVVDSTLRPALVVFCDFRKRTPSLVAGMHRAISLFPALFSASFADKLIATLKDDFLAFVPTDARPGAGQHRADDGQDAVGQPALTTAEAVEMVCLIVDTFRVFSLNATFDCADKHIRHLCVLVGRLADVWRSDVADDAASVSSSFDSVVAETGSFDERREEEREGDDPVAKLDKALAAVLYHHPAIAVDCLLASTSGKAKTTAPATTAPPPPMATTTAAAAATAASTVAPACASLAADVGFARAAVARVAALPGAHPIRDEIARRSGQLLGGLAGSGTCGFGDAWRTGVFADITLLVGEAEGEAPVRISAHRVVLSQRSSYFRALLTNGMRESFESEVPVRCDAAHLRLLLEWMYTGELCLPRQADAVIALYQLADQLGLEQPCGQCERALVSPKLMNEASVEYILRFAEWRDEIGPAGGGSVLLQTCRSFVLARMGRVDEGLLRSTLRTDPPLAV